MRPTERYPHRYSVGTVRERGSELHGTYSHCVRSTGLFNTLDVCPCRILKIVLTGHSILKRTNLEFAICMHHPTHTKIKSDPRDVCRCKTMNERQVRRTQNNELAVMATQRTVTLAAVLAVAKAIGLVSVSQGQQHT